ncbi:MAG: YdcF family protein [Bacteroidetes bacterium]|nr:YdcF family protein [Bacteroidota bacterium]
MLKIKLLKNKKTKVLTLQAWLLIILIIFNLFILFKYKVYPFLATNKTVNAEILVVEGWLPDYALKNAVNEYKTNNYKIIITTGVPLLKGYYLSEYQNFANISKKTLIKLGLDETKIIAIPTKNVKKDRTYASAIAVRNWLNENKPRIKSINVYTLGSHSRRTLLLYNEAFNNDVIIGIYAHNNRDFKDKEWWTTSQGVRTVIGNFIAYIYAKFFFYP